MKAAVLSVGSELLRGDIVDTNAAFLTRHVSQMGFQVQRVQAVGDDLEMLEGAITDALAVAEIVVTTGGLGPTQDDLTREAIAATFHEELFYDESLIAEIESRFAGMGRRMAPRNRKQGFLIPSAEAIRNPNGTAPGWYVRNAGRVVAAMPGPPGEMQPMWRDSMQPRLESLLQSKLAMLSIMTFGVGESAVEERIDDVIAWRDDVTVATYAKSEGVEIHITARAPTEEEAAALVSDAASRIHQRLGAAVFGTGDVTLSSAVGQVLAEEGLSIAVIESVTGGTLASMITDHPGSSNYFLGGVVAYTRESKARYGVDTSTMDSCGLISPQTAIAMAKAAQVQFDADIGLSTTGVAGTEPVEGHPPGTVFVAFALHDKVGAHEIHRPASRDVVKRFSAQCALDLLRRQIQDSA